MSAPYILRKNINYALSPRETWFDGPPSNPIQRPKRHRRADRDAEAFGYAVRIDTDSRSRNNSPSQADGPAEGDPSGLNAPNEPEADSSRRQRGSPGSWVEFGSEGPRRPRRGRRNRGDVKAAVMLLLAERPRHGYEILTELSDRSGGNWKASPGSIYPVLKSLSRKGLVRPEEEDGRRVFHLTSTGRELVAADGESWGKPWKTRKGISDSAQDALTQEAQRLAGAVWQVSQSPDPELIQSVTQTLSQARKEIFLALADEVDTTPGSLGQATSPSEDQTDPHSTETSSAPTSE